MIRFTFLQFIVGSETTSTMLLWTMLYLLHHEDAQAMVHGEIEKVGQDTGQESHRNKRNEAKKQNALENHFASYTPR